MRTATLSPGDEDDREHLEELTRQALEAGVAEATYLAVPSILLRRRRLELRATLLALRQTGLDRDRRELASALDAIVARAPLTLRARRSSPPTHPGADPAPTGEPFWSPVPIRGFRAWEVRAHLHGAKRVWYTPEYAAGCLRGRSEVFDSDVPHSDGSCGDPPCGIYATKEPDPIVHSWRHAGRPVAFGVAELTGKVVEHQFGYRAARARAVALVVVDGSNLSIIEGTDQLGRLFADPRRLLQEVATTDRAGDGAHPGRLVELLRLLRDRDRPPLPH